MDDEIRGTTNAPSRRLNLRFVLVLLVATGVTAATVAGVHEYQVARNAEFLLDRAREAHAADDPEAARRHLREYLAFRPNNAVARAEYALLLDSLAETPDQWRAAYFELERALRADPARDELRRRIVATAGELGRHEDALDHARLLLNRYPEDAWLVHRVARSHEGLADFDAAAEQYVEAISLDETGIEPRVDLVRMIERYPEEVPLEVVSGREDATADEVVRSIVDRMVEKGKPRVDAYLARAEHHRRRGRLKEAADDLGKVLAIAENNPQALWLSAETALERARLAAERGDGDQSREMLERAEEYTRRGLEGKQPDPRLYLVLSGVDSAGRKVPEGISHLRQGLAHLGELRRGDVSTTRLRELAEIEVQLVFALADMLITAADRGDGTLDSEMIAEVDRLQEQLDRMVNVPALIEFLDGRRLFLQRRFHRASLALQSARPALVDQRDVRRRIDLALAECYAELANPRAQLVVLQRSVRDDAGWMQGHLELAGALAAQGRIDQAIEEYLQVENVRGVRFQIARLLTRKQLQRPEEQRDWSPIEKLLDEGDGRDRSPELATLRAEILTQRRRFDEADRLLADAEAEFGDDALVPAARAALVLRRQDVGLSQRLARADRLLEAAEKSGGPTPRTLKLRVERALLSPEAERGPRLQSVADRAEALSPVEQRRVLPTLAAAWERLDQPERADAVWQRLSRENPGDVLVQLAMAERAAERGDAADVERALERLRAAEGPDGPNGNVVEAQWLLQQAGRDSRGDSSDRLHRARRLLETARRRGADPAVVLRTLAAIEDFSGNDDEAYDLYQQAIDNGDRSRGTLLRVLAHLDAKAAAAPLDEKEQHWNEATRLTNMFAADDPTVLAGEVARAASKLAWLRRDFGQAIDLAAETAASSDDPDDLILLSRMRSARGQRGEPVEQPLRRAVELAPEEPRVWLAIVAHYARIGRVSDARSTIETAGSQLPPNLRSLTVGRCFALLNDVEQAERHLLLAVEEAPRDVRTLRAAAAFFRKIGRVEQANRLLRRIVEGEADASVDDVASARREQAMLLLVQGGYDRSVQAVEILEGNVGSDGRVAIEDLRAKAAILAERPIRRDRLAAIEALREIEKRQDLVDRERLLLAKLLDLTGDWPAARAAYLEVASGDVKKPEHVAAFVRALVAHDEVDAAEQWVAVLQEIDAGSFSAAEAEARVLAARGRAEEACLLLETHLRDHQPVRLPEVFDQLVDEEELPAALDEPLRQLERAGDEAAIAALRAAQRARLEGESQDALSVLRQHRLERRVEEQRHRRRLERSAAFCEEAEQFDRAERLLTRLVDWTGDAASYFTMAKFLARRDRIDEALDWCERGRPLGGEEWLASASTSVIGRSSVVGSNTATPEQIARVERWVEDALEKHPESTTVLVATADLRLLQRRLAEAEELYRRILPGNERHIVALNNLSWLLAFRRQEAEEALQFIDRAIEIAGPRPELLDTRAVIQLNRDNPVAAVEDLRQALQDVQDEPFAIGHLHLAEALWRSGDDGEARRMLLKARDGGLQRRRLHPLERERYDTLVAALTGEG